MIGPPVAPSSLVVKSNLPTSLRDTRIVEPWLYVIILGCLELISSLSNLQYAVLGGWLHVVFSSWLLYRGSQQSSTPYGKYLLLFSSISLIRVISLAVSPAVFPGIWFYIVTESLVMAAALVASRMSGMRARDFGLTLPTRLWVIPCTVLTGFFAGWIEYHIIHPASLTDNLEWSSVWLPSFALVVFTGFVEEAIFRGILFSTADQFCSRLQTTFLTSTDWMVLHMAWHSPMDLLLVFCSGLVWGWVRQYTGSILPVAVAHGVSNVMLYIIIPNLQG